MGEPDSMSIDAVKELALTALDPKGIVSAQNLREMGLHRAFVQRYFSAIQPEIKHLVGWKGLEEYNYVAYWQNHSVADRTRAAALSETWWDTLAENGLMGQRAVRIYDGEMLRPPAPDYRLFVLRDARLLYYEGGFHARKRNKFVCGDVTEVLDVLDGNYSNGTFESVTRQPFLIITNSLADALKNAIADRERKAKTQKALEVRLRAAIEQVSGVQAPR